MPDATNQYAIWLKNLHVRLINLQNDMPSLPYASAERELSTCKSQAEHLESYASQHNIDFHKFYEQFIAIERIVVEIKSDLEFRNRPWYKKLASFLNGIVSIVEMVLKIFHFGDLPRLPDGRKPKQLPSRHRR